MSDRLSTIQYSPPDEPTLFDLWATGQAASIPAPLACHDSSYQRLIVDLITKLGDGDRAPTALVSVGAGTGILEAQLAQAGLDVLAADLELSAVRMCATRGLRTAQFDLLRGTLQETFNIIYCDGLLGHLWQPSTRCMAAWSALARLGSTGAYAVVSNDLADDDNHAQFNVRSDATARFYRPPAGHYVSDALATGRWSIIANQLYTYRRGDSTRRREIVIARLLMNERVEA